MVEKTCKTHQNIRKILVFYTLLVSSALVKKQMNDYTNRHAIKQTPWCEEACTSTCKCDRKPFPGRPDSERTQLRIT